MGARAARAWKRVRDRGRARGARVGYNAPGLAINGLPDPSGQYAVHPGGGQVRLSEVLPDDIQWAALRTVPATASHAGLSCLTPAQSRQAIHVSGQSVILRPPHCAPQAVHRDKYHSIARPTLSPSGSPRARFTDGLLGGWLALLECRRIRRPPARSGRVPRFARRPPFRTAWRRAERSTEVAACTHYPHSP